MQKINWAMEINESASPASLHNSWQDIQVCITKIQHVFKHINIAQ